ncbi:MerR family transcriptional regulator [Paraliobacillus salinarum]|uniref:MerR family transcriptional regulator n=1 Tax=Paraliobacillus salinarum TaxID=1158996 RepID=UPI0015F6AA14|nr:cobalamin B12-binding domain-containing protein [Paraliobacillus salinarum]
MYGIKKAAELVGITPITLRAWEHRYGVVIPERTKGGTRIYTEENINDLLLVNQYKKQHEISVQQAMAMLKSLKMKKNNGRLSPSNQSHFTQTIDNVFEALLNYQTAEAAHFLNTILDTTDAEEVFHQVCIPLLRKVGDEWEKGNLIVTQEHFISQFIKQKIMLSLQSFEHAKTHPKALAICPPQELHDIGLLLFSFFLQKRGIDVLFIGENTPVENLIPLIEANHIDLICFSVTMEEHVCGLEAFIDLLSTQKPELNFVIGGYAAEKVCNEFKKYVISGDMDDWNTWLEQSNHKKSSSYI